MTESQTEHQAEPRPAVAPTRRGALAGVAGLGVGLPLLAACGTGSSGSAGSGGSVGGTGGSAGGSGSAGAPLASASDVPVGGGEIVADAGVVVTQPTSGQFKAFSATCTHAGCQVGSVSDGQIVCPCHGSHFSITDGSVTQGPATSPLAEVRITVKNGQITRA